MSDTEMMLEQDDFEEMDTVGDAADEAEIARERKKMTRAYIDGDHIILRKNGVDEVLDLVDENGDLLFSSAVAHGLMKEAICLLILRGHSIADIFAGKLPDREPPTSNSVKLRASDPWRTAAAFARAEQLAPERGIHAERGKRLIETPAFLALVEELKPMTERWTREKLASAKKLDVVIAHHNRIIGNRMTVDDLFAEDVVDEGDQAE
jgi:hypothetical protein